MGITIHYRGVLKDLDRVEDFEDRVLDLALELGGQAHIWRTSCDTDPSRIVRGIILDLCPGQETTSLLISPEGWLIGLADIEDAENGKLDGDALVLRENAVRHPGRPRGGGGNVPALKAEFFPDLEVSDEGDYWETRDVKDLAAKLDFLQSAIEILGEGLEQYGLTSEAAEDPEILAARIARVAQLVQKTLKRPSEHPPVHWEDEDSALDDEGPSRPRRKPAGTLPSRKTAACRSGCSGPSRSIFPKARRRGGHDAAMHEETAAGLPADEADEDADREDWRESLPEEVAG